MDISDSGERRALRRKLKEIIWDFICEHWWRVIIGLGSFIAGGAVAYVGIYVQLSDARHAAEDARTATSRLEAAISQLATRDQLDAARERIKRLEDNWDEATTEAGTAPVPRHRRR